MPALRQSYVLLTAFVFYFFCLPFFLPFRRFNQRPFSLNPDPTKVFFTDKDTYNVGETITASIDRNGLGDDGPVESIRYSFGYIDPATSQIVYKAAGLVLGRANFTLPIEIKGRSVTILGCPQDAFQASFCFAKSVTITDTIAADLETYDEAALSASFSSSVANQNLGTQLGLMQQWVNGFKNQQSKKRKLAASAGDKDSSAASQLTRAFKQVRNNFFLSFLSFFYNDIHHTHMYMFPFYFAFLYPN
jgi:hypothetical protein